MGDPADIFDQIAEEVTTHPNWANPKRFAAAFRAEFSQRTCGHCRHVWRGIERDLENNVSWCSKGVGRPDAHTFGCSLWEPKAMEREP